MLCFDKDTSISAVRRKRKLLRLGMPTGQSLEEAIRAVDDATAGGAAYFMVNCAHPDHFVSELEDSDWARRIRGLRCNASRKSHAELDQCTALDDGNPEELASQYTAILSTMPWLNVFWGLLRY